jgi:hypothetical protein
MAEPNYSKKEEKFSTPMLFWEPSWVGHHLMAGSSNPEIVHKLRTALSHLEINILATLSGSCMLSDVGKLLAWEEDTHHIEVEAAHGTHHHSLNHQKQLWKSELCNHEVHMEYSRTRLWAWEDRGAGSSLLLLHPFCRIIKYTLLAFY